MTTAELPLDDWRLLLAALCAGSPAWIGTPGPPERFQVIFPTRFDWLARAQWRAPREPGGAGLAVLELAAPGTVPATAWETLCGTLTEVTTMRDARALSGRYKVPGTAWEAELTLTTDWAADPAVLSVCVRTQVVAPPA